MARSSYSRQRPMGGGFELFAWYFMRISGLLLVLMALGHIVIMHIINSVEVINYAFVARRWAVPFWRVYDWILLALGVLHGSNGIRVVVGDDVPSRGWPGFLSSALFVVGFVVVVVGTEGLLTLPPGV